MKLAITFLAIVMLCASCGEPEKNLPTAPQHHVSDDGYSDQPGTENDGI